MGEGGLHALAWVVTAIRAGEVFEALAGGTGAIEDVAEGVGWRGGVTGFEDVDQQPRGIAIAFG